MWNRSLDTDYLLILTDEPEIVSRYCEGFIPWRFKQAKLTELSGGNATWPCSRQYNVKLLLLSMLATVIGRHQSPNLSSIQHALWWHSCHCPRCYRTFWENILVLSYMLYGYLLILLVEYFLNCLFFIFLKWIWFWMSFLVWILVSVLNQNIINIDKPLLGSG